MLTKKIVLKKWLFLSLWVLMYFGSNCGGYELNTNTCECTEFVL